MKKVLAMVMTFAVVLVLGMGNVGCSKKETADKKTESKTTVNKEKGGTETKTESKEVKTETKKP